MKARNPCPKCVEKHLAQAVILMQEAENGYPEHKLLAVGHLAEAEAECPDAKWREKFRAIRHQIQGLDLSDDDLVLEEVLFEYGQ